VKTQFIEHNGEPEYAVVPIAEYRALLEKAEALEDVVAYDAARAALETGADELVPSDVVDAILGGESPVKVWRKHRGMTQTELAEAAGSKQPHIAQIESGQRTGTVAIMKRIAQVLGVDVDDLIA